MKLVIFTPATIKSAIGRMACLVVQALTRQGHHVVVVRTEDLSHIDGPHHPFGVDVLRWDGMDEVRAALDAADEVIYQIGDNYQFHRGCLEWLPDAPGIVCLHDYFLGHLFCGWAEFRRAKALAILRAWYSETTASSYFSHDTKTFISHTVETAPMTEWIASMATGVVTHSSWAIERVMNSCPGPVHVIALAYDAPQLSLSPAETSRADDRLTILTIGHINPNKRAESVIRAIGHSRLLREKVRYRLVGPIAPSIAQQLRKLASRLDVDLLISGEADDRGLQQAIQEADIMCCLRLPALEAASASAIESMLCGKPTVVMDTGFYSELPDEYVRKIAPDRELSDLQVTLEGLCLDEEQRLALGRDAAAWAVQHFSGDKYARGLLEICESAARSNPILEMSSFYTGTLGKWGQLSDGSMAQITAPLSLYSA
jgi:glycosyltransferase involved in cell wall biosynthesis